MTVASFRRVMHPATVKMVQEWVVEQVQSVDPQASSSQSFRVSVGHAGQRRPDH